MKKIFLSILIIGFVFSGLMAQSGRKSRSIKPTVFQKRVTTQIGEKTRYYYSLNDKKPSTINVQGPGKIRIITRGRFIPNEGNKIAYEIVYSVDGEKENRIKIKNVERSKTAIYLKGSLGVPGQLKDFEIEIGRGYHTLEFYITDKKIPVAARYFFTPIRYKKQEWISFCPIRPSTPVDLITKESTVNYYRFSTEKPLRVTVNGPTELRVLTRIENHYQMKGRIHYRMQVMENGEIINTYQLSSRRSEVTIYKDNTELIPGKACEFVINVPEGRHTYEVLPLDKDKNTLLGRFLLPKKDVKLE
ncbi:MAG: hypothetical protein QM503_11380 [Bacteroidota bacterium]